MREIKFRAWITRYDEPFMMYLDPFKNWYDCEDGFLLGFSKEGYSGLGSHECYEDNTEKVQFEIMQYTGFKDRDGKDIYENDILSGHSDGSGRVQWSEFDGGYDYVFSDGNVVGIYEVLKQCKVIGNMFESPNLIFN